MKKNVILITVDSMRSDCFGPALTPELSAWSERGLRFQQAVSGGPLTSASFPALLRSRHGSHGGMKPGTPSLAGVLAAAGYRTGAFIAANPYLSAAAGYDAGFELFWDGQGGGATPIAETFTGIAGTGNRFRRLLGRRRLPALQFINGLRGHRRRPFPPGESVADKAIAWAGTSRQPFFLWAHLMDLHYPYMADGREDGVSMGALAAGLGATLLGLRGLPGRVMRRLYEQRVRDIDRIVSRLLNALGDDALVVFTADHGEQFGERGRFAHPASLFDEQLLVPLVISGTGEAGGNVAGQFSLIDLCPTILGMLGLQPASSFEGRDRSAALRESLDKDLVDVALAEAVHVGDGQVPDHVAAAGRGRETLYCTFAARTRDWKFICDEEGSREMLFDLDHDPREGTDILAREPERAAVLRGHVAAHRRLARPDEGAAGAALSPEEQRLLKKQLEDLGYL